MLCGLAWMVGTASSYLAARRNSPSSPTATPITGWTCSSPRTEIEDETCWAPGPGTDRWSTGGPAQETVVPNRHPYWCAECFLHTGRFLLNSRFSSAAGKADVTGSASGAENRSEERRLG